MGGLVSYSTLTSVLHVIQFIFLQAALTTTAPAKACFLLIITSRRSRRRASLAATAAATKPPKGNGLKFTSLTSPHTQKRHHSRTGKLQTPPEQVGR